MLDVYGERIPVESLAWLRFFYRQFISFRSVRLRMAFEQFFQQRQLPGSRADEAIEQSTSRLERAFAFELSKIEVRAQLAQLTPASHSMRAREATADVFICHASEDKFAVALPLSKALIAKGCKVWLDQFQLKLGDQLLAKIDEGLATCRFGVVILSPRFFEKKWPRRELAGLAAREDAEDRKLILPVWYNIDQAGIATHSPLLASALGVRWSDGLDVVVAEIARVLREPNR